MILNHKFRRSASWQAKLALLVLSLSVLPLAATAISQENPAPVPVRQADDGPSETAPDRKSELVKLDGSVRSVVWSGDGKLFASVSTRRVPATEDGPRRFDWFETVRIHDAQSGKELHSLGELKKRYADWIFSPDGSLLALSWRDNDGDHVELWDTATAGLRHKVALDYARVNPTLAFAPDSRTLAVAYGGLRTELMMNGARLIEVRTGRELQTLAQPGSMGPAPAFSPDGQLMATGDYSSGSVRLWSVATGQQISQLAGVNGTALVVAFSPDGKTLACGSTGSGIQLWDVSTSKPKSSPVENPPTCTQLVFSPDSRLLAAASPALEPQSRRDAATTWKKTEVRVWNVASGKLLVTIPDASDSLAFAPDGESLHVLVPGGGIQCVTIPKGTDP
jgi:WD40 repeat protein